MEDFAPYGNMCYRYLGDNTYTVQKARSMCESANARLPDFSEEADFLGFRDIVEESESKWYNTKKHSFPMNQGYNV